MSGHGFRDRNGCKAQQLRGGYHAPRSCFYPVALTEGAGVLTTQNAKDKGVVLAASVSYFLNGHLGVQVLDYDAGMRNHNAVLVYCHEHQRIPDWMVKKGK